jgi:hypothetical protein
MWRTGIAAATVLYFACAVRADFTPPNPPNLQIRGVVEPIGSELSWWLTLGIENTDVSDKLKGWQLVLQIDDPLHANVSITDWGVPDSYVLASGSTGLFYYPELASDAGLPGDGYVELFGDSTNDPEVVRSDVKQNLLKIQLTADYAECFNIRVVPDDGLGTCSNWWSLDYSSRNFDVFAVDDQSPWIVASIPEPQNGVTLSSGLIAAVLYWELFRKGRRLRSVVPLLRCLNVLQVKTVHLPVPR